MHLGGLLIRGPDLADIATGVDSPVGANEARDGIAAFP
jgi:hypothetical protein